MNEIYFIFNLQLYLLSITLLNYQQIFGKIIIQILKQHIV